MGRKKNGDDKPPKKRNQTMVSGEEQAVSRYLKEANYLKFYKRETRNQITIEFIQILNIFFCFSALNKDSFNL